MSARTSLKHPFCQPIDASRLTDIPGMSARTSLKRAALGEVAARPGGHSGHECPDLIEATTSCPPSRRRTTLTFRANNELVVAGTRIPVRSIKEFSKAGYSVSDTRKEYPTLTEEDPAQVVGYWAGEARGYDIRSHTCSGVCGHYTQIVWGNTRSVGCAVATDRRREVRVCNYDPPGNSAGYRPY